MAVNKVVYGGETVIDLTNDSVTPETLALGVTAHDKSGNAIVGTMVASTAEDLDTELTEQETLIAELSTILDTKASGGSGGSVETCTLTIAEDGPNTMYAGSLIAELEDGTVLSGTEFLGQYVVRKNSIMCVGVIPTGDVTQINKYGDHYYVYQIKGDCYITANF